MQNLIRRNMVAIKDYDYMKTMDDNVEWMKPTCLLSNFYLNLRVPFYTSALTS